MGSFYIFYYILEMNINLKTFFLNCSAFLFLINRQKVDKKRIFKLILKEEHAPQKYQFTFIEIHRI